MEWDLKSLNSFLNNCIETCQLQQWTQLDTHLGLIRTSQVALRSISLDRPSLDKIHALFKLINDRLEETKEEFHYQLLCNVFRLLRNCCSGSYSNIYLVERHTDLLNLTCEWLSKHAASQENYSSKKLDAIKCFLQFCSNAVAGPSEKRKARKWIFQSLDCTNCKLLASPDDSVVKIISAVIYHCLLDNDVLDESISCDFLVASLFDDLLSRCQDNLSEWSLFILELFLENNINLKAITNRSTSHLIHLYDIILNMVRHDNDHQHIIRIKECNIATLLDLLKEKLLALAQKTDKEWVADEISSTAKLILIACEISCNEEKQSPSLNEENLFKNTIEALRRIHALHKAKPLSDIKSNKNSEPDKSGLATLKRDLVRLVSNLLYNRPCFQLIASQIDAVPLILDLHSFDMNNPFIREWATNATRNLLYNCQENIEIARGIKDLNINSDPQLMEQFNLQIKDGKVVPKRSDSK